MHQNATQILKSHIYILSAAAQRFDETKRVRKLLHDIVHIRLQLGHRAMMSEEGVVFVRPE